MLAVDVLRRAGDYGVQAALHENRLRLTAPRKPPDDLLAELRGHKAEIIAFLSRPEELTAIDTEGREFETGKLAVASPADGGKKSPWDATDYKALFDERVAILQFDGGIVHSEAEARATEHCVVEWLNRHPSSSPAGHCAWCGQPEAGGAAVVPFGTGDHHTWLHPRCWPAWYQRRRADALAALRSFCIPVPAAARTERDTTAGRQSGIIFS
jgi:hypothetical protein